MNEEGEGRSESRLYYNKMRLKGAKSSFVYFEKIG